MSVKLNAPMTHRDPTNPVQKAIRSHIGYHMRCQQCGADVFLHRGRKVRKFRIREGFRDRYFCNAKCLAEYKACH